MTAADTDRQTPPRHQAAFAVAAVYARACEGEDVIELLHGLLVSMLEPRQREVYEWFTSGRAGGYTTSKRVAEVFDIKRNDSSTILKLLVQIGLLERYRFPHAQGGLYYYGLPGLADEIVS